MCLAVVRTKAFHWIFRSYPRIETSMLIRGLQVKVKGCLPGSTKCMRDFEAICHTTVPFDLFLIESAHPDLACDLDVTLLVTSM